MAGEDPVEVTALAINVAVPEALQWRDTRRGEEFLLTTLNVRLLPDGRLAAKAYGRPTAGGRGTYTSFAGPADRPELRALIEAAAARAAELRWSGIVSVPLAQGYRLAVAVRGDEEVPVNESTWAPPCGVSVRR